MNSIRSKLVKNSLVRLRNAPGISMRTLKRGKTVGGARKPRSDRLSQEKLYNHFSSERISLWAWLLNADACQISLSYLQK